MNLKSTHRDMRSEQEILKELEEQRRILKSMGIVEEYRHPETEKRVQTLCWVLGLTDRLPRYLD